MRAVGATWLDNLRIRCEAPGSVGLGAAVRVALREILARDLLATLRRRDLPALAGVLAGEAGLSDRVALDGQAVTGIHRRPVALASGRLAMLDDGQGRTLVPWRPVIEPRLGHWLGAVLRSGSLSWRPGRQIELARRLPGCSAARRPGCNNARRRGKAERVRVAPMC